MRIDTQNSFWSQVMGKQKTGNLMLTGSMKAAEARQASQQQEFLQKVSALAKDGQAGSTQKKQSGPKDVDGSASSEFIVSKANVPQAIEGEMERYYQALGNLADNLTGMEEQLKYMQAEYERAAAEGNTEKASVIQEWNEKQYQDMSWMVGANLGISHFRMDNAERLYGEDFGRAAEDLMGDLPDKAKDIAKGLTGAKSVDEALAQIAAAKEQLTGLAEDVAGRYQAYSGRELSAYEYKTAEDFAGVKWDSHLIYPSGSLESADQLVGAEYLKKLDLSQYLQAGNLIDVQA